MSKKGGYQIIDLKRKPLTFGVGNGKIPGLYSSIMGTKKAYLLTGAIIEGKEYDDIFVPVLIEQGMCSIFVLAVDVADIVVIRVLEDDSVVVASYTS